MIRVTRIFDGEKPHPGGMMVDGDPLTDIAAPQRPLSIYLAGVPLTA